MGKRIIWSIDSLNQLEDIHFYILFESKSIIIADKVVETIFESTKILETNHEVYKLDDLKSKNDGSFRVYFVYNYMISFQVIQDDILILRVRHTSRKPKKLLWKT
jgi:plasmid stabilization system protein ParE